MKSTADFHDPAPYIGADLTDRHARARRPIDVCGLWPAPEDTLAARFWSWTWPAASEPLQVEAIATEIRSARAAMLDGPQALAAADHDQRACERALRAPGKTPDHLQATNKPFSGYLRSSVELFAALHGCGIRISPPGFLGGACEYYPGDAWRRLADEGPASKDTREGRLQRRELLVSLGVIGLPDLPSHDQADACLGAVLAAAADHRIRGLTVEAVGEPLAVDADGVLREGVIAVPRADEGALHRVDGRIGTSTPRGTTERVCASGSTAPEHGTADARAMERAEALFECLLRHARGGEPRICTYADAYQRIFGYRPGPWLPSHAGELVRVARAVAPVSLGGLGMVRLDTFIVAAANHTPGSGYWETSDHDEDDWREALGSARLLE